MGVNTSERLPSPYFWERSLKTFTKAPSLSGLQSAPLLPTYLRLPCTSSSKPGEPERSRFKSLKFKCIDLSIVKVALEAFNHMVIDQWPSQMWKNWDRMAFLILYKTFSRIMIPQLRCPLHRNRHHHGILSANTTSRMESSANGMKQIFCHPFTPRSTL